MKKSELSRDPYANLSTAIVRQAMDDYEKLFFDRFTAKDTLKRNRARKDFDSARNFFLGDRQNNYTILKDMNGKEILEKLDKKILQKVYESLDNIRAYCLSNNDCQICKLYNKETGMCEGSMPYFKS